MSEILLRNVSERITQENNPNLVGHNVVEENRLIMQMPSVSRPTFPGPPPQLQMIDSMFDNIDNDIEMIVLPDERKHSRLDTTNESVSRYIRRNNYVSS